MQVSTRLSPPAQSVRQDRLYEPLDFLQVRVPLFPVEAYLTLHDPIAVIASGLHTENPLVRRALAVGSMALLDELERASSSPRDIARRERKLLRYLIRMATRSTPYGLFAGVALARWGEQTDLSVAPGPRGLSSRPDMHWLLALTRKLETLPTVREHLLYCANTAAYVRRGRIFLLEQLALGQPRQGETVSLRATGVALRALNLARKPISYADLVDALLASTPGATRENVERLIATLWQHTLLFTHLHPPLTGDNPAYYLLKCLEQIPVAAALVALLRNYLCALEEWNHTEDEMSVEGYRALLQRATRIEAEVDELVSMGQPAWASKVDAKMQHSSSTVLQIDTTFALAGGQLAKSIGEEAAQAAELMQRLSPLPRGFRYLQEYRNAFLERYGLDREVPLLELLDPQIGLGIPATYTGSNASAPISAKQEFPERDRELMRLALTALRERQLVVSLEEEHVKRLETLPPANTILPLSLDIYVLLAAASPQALDRGEYQLVVGPNVGVPQAGRNLGRFAEMLGTEAHQGLKQVAEREATLAPHVLLAELVYEHKEARTANVALRPAVRAHEVTYGVMPGVEPERTIPLHELAVGVRGEQFYVRWPARQVEVHFCAGHMLNALKAPAVIRLLSDLSYDRVPLLSHLQWEACAGFPFLPRIQVGRIVLSLAQWLLNSTFHLPELVLETHEQFWETLGRWRERWFVPRYVSLAEGDNCLLLDLESREQAEELRAALREVKDARSLILQEALPGPEHAWLEGPGGHYLAEYVVSLIKRKAEMQPEAEDLIRPPVMEYLERQRPPGSEWLFMKMYCAQALHDDMIAGPLRTFVRDALARHLAEDWFFIRYADPEPHLRLRFRGDPHVLTTQLLPELCAWASRLMSDGPCRTFTFDVYDREIERYGGPLGMDTAETFFCADSNAITEILHLKQKKALPVKLPVVAVLTTDDLLAALGLAPAERLQWSREGTGGSKAFGTAYRQKSAELRALLGEPGYVRQLTGGEQLAEVLATRRARLVEVGQHLTNAARQQRLNQPPERIYRSFVHMHCNRLLGIDREAERQVGEMLQRTWMGLLQARP